MAMFDSIDNIISEKEVVQKIDAFVEPQNEGSGEYIITNAIFQVQPNTEKLYILEKPNMTQEQVDRIASALRNTEIKFSISEHSITVLGLFEKVLRILLSGKAILHHFKHDSKHYIVLPSK